MINNINGLLNYEEVTADTILWIDWQGHLRTGQISEAVYVRVPLYSSEEKQRIVVHEAGHAICAATLLGPEQIRDVSISTAIKNDTPGVTKLNPGSNLLTKDLLFKQICILLVGRMAEQIVYQGDTSAGCSHDLTEASKRVFA